MLNENGHVIAEITEDKSKILYVKNEISSLEKECGDSYITAEMRHNRFGLQNMKNILLMKLNDVVSGLQILKTTT
jgi:hypothetical protein